ncbi:DUF1264-domain-containing protein [Phanerochaete sordida]|uniref:DUF1264-domain-containing protein n=1 Tax=Phanerochaete sordida TaxID=48140 RepID=A0A9P3L9A4_9APHY|nr:DUF1264-domain-containing protein [Phanerochaete sordida]
MDTDTKRATYHSAAYNTAGAAMMSFAPINDIHQHICAFHTYADDRTRHVEAHHFCTCLRPDLHQCIIYDSGEKGARLIGIEYIITEQLFNDLPEDEKNYWHSHKYEVESGMLQLQVKSGVPQAAADVAEQPAMLELQRTYGKTIHTWAFDKHPDIPLGPPKLMMSYSKDEQAPPAATIKARDEKWGMDSEAKRRLRAGYLPPYEKHPDSDKWETTGKAVVFEPVERAPIV